MRYFSLPPYPNRYRLFALLLLLISICCLSGCPDPLPAPVAPPVKKQQLSAVPPQQALQLAGKLDIKQQRLASWQAMLPALRRSLAYVSVKSPAQVAVTHPDYTFTWGQIKHSLEELIALAPALDSQPELLGRHFTWFSLSPVPLMTGYYAPLVEASKKRTQKFRYPLYPVPDDLQVVDLEKFHPRWKGQRLIYRMERGKALPYWDRDAIDYQNALATKARPLAFAKDPVDVFFLQIQGSGILRFQDGTTRYALYAGKNGRPYASLGRTLIKKGLLQKEGVSMQSIRRYMQQHPQQERELLSTNPSYVFFRLGKQGPFGAMGQLLTPRVSIAADPQVFPLGSILVIDTVLPPVEPGAQSTPTTALVLTQDTGGAIKKQRLDYYCGAGIEVEYLAGHIKTPAKTYMLISRSVLPR